MTATQYLALVDSCIKHEGYRGTPYDDGRGNLTIGYGRNLDARPLSRAEAKTLLEHDLCDAIVAAQHYPWYETLDGVRQSVVAEMIFNMGAQTFATFGKTIAAIDARDYEGAASQMLKSKWAKQVKGRAVTLAQRMRTGGN